MAEYAQRLASPRGAAVAATTATTGAAAAVTDDDGLPLLPDDLSSLLGWIRRVAADLAAADPCAPIVTSGKTNAELALELCAPQQQCQLFFSMHPQQPQANGSAPVAIRLVSLLHQLLAELERRRREADDLLRELPSLLSRLASHGGETLRRAAFLPPTLAIAVLNAPNPPPVSGSTLRAELGHGGALGGKMYRDAARRLLAALRRWREGKYGWLVHPPPRMRAEEMARVSPRMRAALCAATAAAAALCQAVRWAEAAAASEFGGGAVGARIAAGAPPHEAGEEGEEEAAGGSPNASHLSSSWVREVAESGPWAATAATAVADDRGDGAPARPPAAAAAPSESLESVILPGLDDAMGLTDRSAYVALAARRLTPTALLDLSGAAHRAGKAAEEAFALAAAQEAGPGGANLTIVLPKGARVADDGPPPQNSPASASPERASRGGHGGGGEAAEGGEALPEGEARSEASHLETPGGTASPAPGAPSAAPTPAEAAQGRPPRWPSARRAPPRAPPSERRPERRPRRRLAAGPVGE